MNDLSLFELPMSQADADRGHRGRTRRGDPETSRQAAEAISSSAEQAIVRLYSIPRSLTDTELCELLPEWHGPTIVSARSRLHRSGWLVDSGQRRKSKRNRDQIVWQRAR